MSSRSLAPLQGEHTVKVNENNKINHVQGLQSWFKLQAALLAKLSTTYSSLRPRPPRVGVEGTRCETAFRSVSMLFAGQMR